MNKTLFHGLTVTAGATLLLCTVGCFGPSEKKAEVAAEATTAVATEQAAPAAENLVKAVADKAQFENFKKEGLVVAKFSAPGCVYCEEMKTADQEMAKKYAEKKVTFVSLESGEGQPGNEIAKEMNVAGFPTYIYFKDGKEVARTAGKCDVVAFEEVIKKAFELQ